MPNPSEASGHGGFYEEVDALFYRAVVDVMIEEIENCLLADAILSEDRNRVQNAAENPLVKGLVHSALDQQQEDPVKLGELPEDHDFTPIVESVVKANGLEPDQAAQVYREAWSQVVYDEGLLILLMQGEADQYG